MIPGSTYHPAVAPNAAAQRRTKERAERTWNEHRHGNQVTLGQAIAEAHQAETYAEWASAGEKVNEVVEGDEPEMNEAA